MRPIVIIIHVGYWSMYLLLIALIFIGLQGPQGTSAWKVLGGSPVGLMAILPNFVSFYGHYLGIFPKFLAHKRLMATLLASILVCAVSAVVAFVILSLSQVLNHAIFDHPKEVLMFTTWLMAVAAVHGILALIISGAIAWYDNLKDRERLIEKNFEMEMALIKAQLNPHFLFNTLNNIDILIEKNPAKASAYLNQLSEIMRFMLYETKTEKIPLSKEIRYLNQYIELQKIRNARPDFVQYEVSGAIEGVFIAPMTLIPFVENAFKYAEGMRESGAIRILIQYDAGTLVFTCQNRHNNTPNPTENGGLGNALMQKRLTLLYPGTHELHLEKNEEWFNVTLRLPQLSTHTTLKP